MGGDKKCKKDKQKAILKWNRNKFEPRRTRAKHNCDKHKNLMNHMGPWYDGGGFDDDDHFELCTAWW